MCRVVIFPLKKMWGCLKGRVMLLNFFFASFRSLPVAITDGVKAALLGLPAIPAVAWAMKNKPNFIK